jgi:hypothetical protein
MNDVRVVANEVVRRVVVATGCTEYPKVVATTRPGYGVVLTVGCQKRRPLAWWKQKGHARLDREHPVRDYSTDQLDPEWVLANERASLRRRDSFIAVMDFSPMWGAFGVAADPEQPTTWRGWARAQWAAFRKRVREQAKARMPKPPKIAALDVPEAEMRERAEARVLRRKAETVESRERNARLHATLDAVIALLDAAFATEVQ